MNPSPSINVPAPHPRPPISLDKFLCIPTLSPASLHPFSSESSDADELDSHESWFMESGTGKSMSPAAHVSLPPRVSVKSGSVRIPSAATSCIGISSGMLQSPFFNSTSCGCGAATCIFGVRSGELMTSRKTTSASYVIEAIGSQNPNPSGGSNAVMSSLSAPLNVPDWSRAHKKNGIRVHGDNRKGGGDDDDDDDDDDEEHDNDKHLPPHEYLARQYARSGNIPFSVLEGAGRTLKGRDLCRVRNAVLAFTGFME